MRIVYIDVDSLRSDHLGCYGYHRATSPVIDGLAAEGVVFECVYTSDAPCLPSRTAFYSGRFGIQTGVVGHGGTAAQPKIQAAPVRQFGDTYGELGLAHRLQLLGLRTAMVSPFAQRHSAHWFTAGFNEMHNTGRAGWESAEEIQPVVNQWLKTNAARDNWFLHVNYWDPHTPYRVPSSYGEPFARDPLPAWLDDEDLIRRHTKLAGPHTALDIGMYDDHVEAQWPRHPGKITDLAGMRHVIDGYDNGVRYMDDHVGMIIAALKAAGVYDDTAIILSADHGENLGELGIYAEHATADEGACHIPLVIKFPGCARGARDRGLHYHLDLAPTLIELLGGDAPAIWQGKSFASVLRAGRGAGREELVIGQCAHVCQRAVRWDQWLYIRTYHDGFHLFPDEMLFDIAADPHEQRDRAGTNQSLCREAAWRLARWHAGQMRIQAMAGEDCVDPLWTVIREGGPCHASLRDGYGDPGKTGFLKYLDRLRATGRAEPAEALLEKYAGWIKTS